MNGPINPGALLRARIFLSGPMMGKPDLNLALFEATRRKLEGLFPSATVTIPHTIKPEPHDTPCPAGYGTGPDGHSSACHLRGQVAALLDCDAVIFLPGWSLSPGSGVEFHVASYCGMQLYEVDGGDSLWLREIDPLPRRVRR